MTPYTYLLINLGSILIPIALSFESRVRYVRHWRQVLLASALWAIPYLLWDAWFTETGIWGFNPDYLVGWYVLGLPLEEILFFVCIPFASLYIYMILRQLLTIKNHPWAKQFVYLLGMGTLVGSVVFFERTYTTVNFLVLGVVLLGLARWARRINWALFFVFFGIVLLPFLIVNGLLTNGTGSGPIVWYNNTENLGIRLIGIPLEDFFYALHHLLGCVWLLERQLQKKKILP